MKEKVFNLAKRWIMSIFLLITSLTTLLAQDYQWAKSIGGTGGDSGRSVIVDSNGNVYTVGYFRGVADFDPGTGIFNLTSMGGYDIFISKLDANGSFLWAKGIGGVDDDLGHCIVSDAGGNIYITGEFKDTVDFNPNGGVYNLGFGAIYSSLFILKLDGNGNFVWAKGMGTSSDHTIGLSISLDVNENIYTTGFFYGTVDFDPNAGLYNLVASGGSDIFISKLNSMGDFVWAKNMGGTNDDSARSIAIDNLGNVYTTGLFKGTADFDPNAGISNLTSAGNSDIFISKLDSTGNFVWARRIGGTTGNEGGMSLVLDTGANIYLTGSFSGTVDFDPEAGVSYLTSTGEAIFVSKLSSNGNHLWARAFSGTGSLGAEGKSVEFHDDNIYITGSFSGTFDFDPSGTTYNLTSAGFGDIFISKLDDGGNFVWAKRIGNSATDYGQSLALDSAGDIYITGLFEDNVDFNAPNAANLNSNGFSDIFIAKYTSTPLSVEETNFGNYFSVYPNPTSNNLTIDFGTVQANTQITLMNALGQEVTRMVNESSSSLQLEIEGAAGIYFLTVQSNNKIATIKVVKQ